eukprot:932420-Rhodomonas_salina.2
MTPSASRHSATSPSSPITPPSIPKHILRFWQSSSPPPCPPHPALLEPASAALPLPYRRSGSGPANPNQSSTLWPSSIADTRRAERSGLGHESDRHWVPAGPGVRKSTSAPDAPLKPDMVMTGKQRTRSGTLVENVTVIRLWCSGYGVDCAILAAVNRGACTSIGCSSTAEACEQFRTCSPPTARRKVRTSDRNHPGWGRATTLEHGQRPGWSAAASLEPHLERLSRRHKGRVPHCKVRVGPHLPTEPASDNAVAGSPIQTKGWQTHQEGQGLRERVEDGGERRCPLEVARGGQQRNRTARVALDASLTRRTRRTTQPADRQPSRPHRRQPAALA